MAESEWDCAYFFQQMLAADVLFDVLKFWDQLSQKVTPELIKLILPLKIWKIAKTLNILFQFCENVRLKYFHVSLSFSSCFEINMLLSLARFQPKCSYKLDSNKNVYKLSPVKKGSKN